MDWGKWKRKISKQNYQKEGMTEFEYKNEWRVRLGDWVLVRWAWGEKKHGMFNELQAV